MTSTNSNTSTSSSSNSSTDIKSVHTEPDMQGWLLKWTNYLKGYQRRWFVLSNGFLSYYRNQTEMMHTCRGNISLRGAFIHTEDSSTFVITNGGAQTFHIKAANEIEMQTWVTALELAKAKANRQIGTVEDDFAEGGSLNNNDGVRIEVTTAVKVLNEKIEELKKCNDSILKQEDILQKSLLELESLDSDDHDDDVNSCKSTDTTATTIAVKAKFINERSVLLRKTLSKMINCCSEYLELATTQGKRWQKMLLQEREKRIQLEEMVEQLAREQTVFEQVSKPSGDDDDGHGHHITTIAENISSEDEDTEFYDAQDSATAAATDSVSVKFLEKRSRNSTRRNSLSSTQMFDKIVSEELAADETSGSDLDDLCESSAILTATIKSAVNIKNKKSRRTIERNQSLQSNTYEFKADEDDDDSESTRNMLLVLSDSAKTSLEEVKKNPWKLGSNRSRRNRIPDKPHHPLHIWSIMKNCIGKDLSKIPMPVNFSEPLSMLQRLTEDFEYANILDTAAKCKDPYEKLAYIAAFTISAYSTTVNRTGKPFNPLLGETFECDRSSDLGWKAVSEQVSHHPPVAAQYCEGRSWVSWQEFTMSSKFRGKYLQLIPSGTSHLQFKDSEDYFTWSKVTTTVHNIIVGKLWVDQEGQMEIINHTNGSKCHLTYLPYSYFTRDQQRKVKGLVINKEGEAKWVINGMWDSKVEIAPVIKVDKETGSLKTGDYVSAWSRILPPSECEKYYNFTEFACQLNEMEEKIAPTDSRWRPDQRLMELGMWDEANIEKLRLEEKQRQKRKEKEKSSNTASIVAEESAAIRDGTCQKYEPVWFKKEINQQTGDFKYIYKNDYWECKEKQDWSRCPTIF